MGSWHGTRFSALHGGHPGNHPGNRPSPLRLLIAFPTPDWNVVKWPLLTCLLLLLPPPPSGTTHPERPKELPARGHLSLPAPSITDARASLYRHTTLWYYPTTWSLATSPTSIYSSV